MSDIEWLSLDEAASRLKISRESVRRTAQRKRWGKRAANDGTVRIAVPIERLNRSAALGHAVGPDGGQDLGHAVGQAGAVVGQDVGHATGQADARALIALLESRVAELDVEAKAGREALTRVGVLEAQLEAERLRVEEWKAVADRFAAQTEQVLAAQARRSWWPWKRLG